MQLLTLWVTEHQTWLYDLKHHTPTPETTATIKEEDLARIFLFYLDIAGSSLLLVGGNVHKDHNSLHRVAKGALSQHGYLFPSLPNGGGVINPLTGEVTSWEVPPNEDLGIEDAIETSAELREAISRALVCQ
jgi:hypothetical protein